MAFELPKISYSGKILEVQVGGGDKAFTVGGESAYPFHTWEGDMPNRPRIAMEIWDMKPEDWPQACLAPFEDVVGDPAAWAKKCVDEYGAEAVVVQLKSTDPNADDAPPEAASETVGKVLDAVDVPVIVWGSANAAKDAEVLKKIAEDHDGKNLLLGPVDEDNHKAIGAAALAYNHSIISSSPIDVNLAKQLNILLGNLGVPMERLVVDPTTGGLGYGLEYSYSVMERIRMAALVQEDDKLILPMINNVGNEVWKSKEARIEGEDSQEANLGDDSRRGVMMEITAAVSYLLAGSDILILRHPETVKYIKMFLDGMLAERAPAAERVQTDRPKAAPLPGAKPAAKAAPKPAPAAAPKPAAPPKPAAEAAPKPAEAPKPAPKEEAKPEPVDAEAKAKAEAEAKAKAEAEAKAKAEAEAKAKAEAEERARQERKAKEAEELAELRRKRREERERRAAEMAAQAKKKVDQDVEYGEGRKPGVAGPDAEYIIRSLDRWRLRGDGILR